MKPKIVIAQTLEGNLERLKIKLKNQSLEVFYTTNPRAALSKASTSKVLVTGQRFYDEDLVDSGLNGDRHCDRGGGYCFGEGGFDRSCSGD